jgi:hypothetical protein
VRLAINVETTIAQNAPPRLLIDAADCSAMAFQMIRLLQPSFALSQAAPCSVITLGLTR